MHSNLNDKLWQVKEAADALAQIPLNDEGLSVLDERFFDVEDYNSYMNPKVLKEKTEMVYDWEFCPSFPNIRCMVRRPTGILVSYIDEAGDEIEKSFEKFEARVFLHELDHINGRTMTHWRISEGNIDVLDEHKEKYPNLMTTVDFYKTKISEVKEQFKGDSFLADDRKHKTVVLKNGEEWKEFTPENRLDGFKIQASGPDMQPSFEETMTIDTIKAMRRDRRTQAIKQQ
jgi:hypothetical protein